MSGPWLSAGDIVAYGESVYVVLSIQPRQPRDKGSDVVMLDPIYGRVVHFVNDSMSSSMWRKLDL